MDQTRIEKVAIVAVGVPGSGKTTFLKPYAQRIDAEYINPDELRAQVLGDATDHSQNTSIWGLVYQQIDDALVRGSVVIDALGTDPAYRRSDIARFKRAGARVIAYQFVAPLELCLARNRGRPRQVPEHAICDAYAELEAHPPSRAEGFDEVIRIDTRTV
jgi:predicted kinase